MSESFPSAFKPYEKVAKITGLSEIKLHQLRVKKLIRAKTSGFPDYTQLINIEDVRNWMAKCMI